MVAAILTPLLIISLTLVYIFRKNCGKLKNINKQLEKENLNLKESLKDTNEKLTLVSQRIAHLDSQFKKVDEDKDEFVSITSHELKTPMTAIKSYLWMALNKADIKLSEKVKRYLSRSLVSTDRLINLVNDILNVSRIQSGKVSTVAKNFNINSLVSEVIADMKLQALEKNITIVFENEKPLTVFADLGMVQEVLVNLLNNAIKFTPFGGRVEVSTFSDGREVEVQVKDDGVGIEKENISKLFKKFGRVDNSYEAFAASSGTGLGLYICKSLVNLMNGEIWANSEGLGKGAAFTFSLPVARISGGGVYLDDSAYPASKIPDSV